MSEGVMIKEAARTLNIGSTTLFKKLRQYGVLNPRSNLPRQCMVQRGYFTLDERQFTKGGSEPGTPGYKQTYYVTLVTPAGLLYIQELLDYETQQQKQRTQS